MGRTALAAGATVVAVVPKDSPTARLAEDGATVVGATDPLVLPDGPVLLLVDDADLVDTNAPDLVTACSRSDVAVVVAGSTEHLKGQLFGWVPMVVRHKAGLVLCPESIFDGQLVGSANFPKGAVFSGPQGRAVLSLAGEQELVQLPSC